MKTPRRIPKDNTTLIHIETIAKLTELLGVREATDVVLLAKRTTILERHWVLLAEAEIREAARGVIANARETGRLSFADVDFGDLLMQHSYAVMREGIESTERRNPVRVERLAAPPKGKIPRSLRALREWWDKYRKGGRMPARQRKEAETLKKAFLDAIQKAWRRHSDDFLSGDTARNTEAVEAIMKAAAVPAARAKMTVETETTYYFNHARREVYDESPDVSHYLFMAVRDHRTTKWCKTRHGLVYAKGDPLLDKETPPCHWFCRSELLPLTPHNANHLALIQDRGRSRRHNSPEPLPKGWTGAR